MKVVSKVTEYPSWHGKAYQISVSWGAWGVNFILRWKHKDYLVGLVMND